MDSRVRENDDTGTQPVMNILITGASGLIGSVLRTQLGATGRYTISGVDARPLDDDSLSNFTSSFTLADCYDYDAMVPAFEGQDAVVHLAANAPVQTPWPDVLRNNIASTHNVYEAAREHGVKRVVFASSNHAVGNFELDEPYKSIGLGDYSVIDNDPANIRQVDHHVPIRPDSDYGVSKVFGEATGRYYNEHFGLEVACLRIGSVVPQNRPTNIRAFATWLSHRDLAHLVDRCLVADISYEIFYGVSNNRWRFWDIEHARETIGYKPQDRAEDYQL